MQKKENTQLAVDKGEHVRPKNRTPTAHRRLLEIFGRACSIFR